MHLLHPPSIPRDLIVFPKSLIPAFPIWSSPFAPTESHHFLQRIANKSIYADGEEVHAIRQAAKKTSAIISVGISEQVRYSTATLLNSNLIIGPNSEVLVHKRKLMPTFFEKLTWSPVTASGFVWQRLSMAK